MHRNMCNADIRGEAFSGGLQFRCVNIAKLKRSSNPKFEYFDTFSENITYSIGYD